ncbi:hypothetical protein V8F44DRAFT_661976 [Aspergillus fumigatus]
MTAICSEKSIFLLSSPSCGAVMLIVHTARNHAYLGIGPKVVKTKSRDSLVLAQTGAKDLFPFVEADILCQRKKGRLFGRWPVTNYNFQHVDQVSLSGVVKTIAMPIADCTAFPHLSPTRHPMMTPDCQNHSDPSHTRATPVFEPDSAVIGSCAKPRMHLTICSQVQAHKKAREPQFMMLISERKSTPTLSGVSSLSLPGLLT